MLEGVWIEGAIRHSQVSENVVEDEEGVRTEVDTVKESGIRHGEADRVDWISALVEAKNSTLWKERRKNKLSHQVHQKKGKKPE